MDVALWRDTFGGDRTICEHTVPWLITHIYDGVCLGTAPSGACHFGLH